MTKYEIMAIIKPDMSADEAQKIATEKIIGRITEQGGNVTFEDFWGERGFAYKIKNYKWGYYFVAQFDFDPEKAHSLRHELNIDTNLVRFMVFKVDKGASEPRKYADMKKEYEAQEKAKTDDKPKEATPGKQAKLTTVKPEAPKAALKDETDKKIDAIASDSAADL